MQDLSDNLLRRNVDKFDTPQNIVSPYAQQNTILLDTRQNIVLPNTLQNIFFASIDKKNILFRELVF